MVADAQAEAWSSRTRCGQIEADLTKRTPTRGDLFSMEVNGKRTTERRVAGGCHLTRDVPAVLARAGWTPDGEKGWLEQEYLPGPAVGRPWTHLSLGVATSV